MYIRHFEIKNIRTIEHFEMTFPAGKEAGWHVLIGDNGSGKSTIIRSAALAMLDVSDLEASRESWGNWLNVKSERGWINVELSTDSKHEYNPNKGNLVSNKISFRLESLNSNFRRVILQSVMHKSFPTYINIKKTAASEGPEELRFILNKSARARRKTEAWFSVAYGPFRRFTGGDITKEKLFKTNPHLGAHLSIFGEDIALSEALSFIQELYIQKLENKTEPDTLDFLIRFVNGANLLPQGTQIDGVDSKNVYFKDGNGNQIPAVQMSDGFRSVLSLTFELIRQLIRVYGSERVFSKVSGGKMIIDLPGVVLVDEIDVHLHPTWQTRIGQWFLKYFPKLQFIVTTHSPLVCRASEKGSIWRLAAPGSNQESGEVTGLDRDRLIYGNVLDAYGTEVFGEDVERSDASKEKLERLAHLSQLNAYGKISAPEKEEMQGLRKILITDDTTEF